MFIPTPTVALATDLRAPSTMSALQAALPMAWRLDPTAGARVRRALLRHVLLSSMFRSIVTCHNLIESPPAQNADARALLKRHLHLTHHILVLRES